ncbi:hypothetical protein [Ureibacillus aquaedulcis]|uniref:Phage protein n=1 Tax=Ureibacillus aquaedulcis TaxID=3058421 RepID=A0ABT8GNU0_9BACL|nr:hypothetical protein [Ureibacillus sp. BA0131]MDN4493088.1 hypothetical protein [Ureibacillus sp. BA0131]
MNPDEVIEKLNTEKIDVAEFSIQCGLSDRTLGNRLAEFDYKQDENGVWYYSGDSEERNVEIDITRKGRVSKPQKKKVRNKKTTEQADVITRQDVDLFTAIMQMPMSESVTRAYKTDKKIDAKFKQIASETKLQINLLHSLALFEFVEKYEPIIAKLKGQSSSEENG